MAFPLPARLLLKTRPCPPPPPPPPPSLHRRAHDRAALPSTPRLLLQRLPVPALPVRPPFHFITACQMPRSIKIDLSSASSSIISLSSLLALSDSADPFSPQR
ncbi:hypothetical protein EV363DRAFT_1397635 [Boletus edulis]|nr:hypothetical protein EV363DRAFT_1397635 [Boletus edulis]